MSAIPSAPPPSYDATTKENTQGGTDNTTNNARYAAGGYGTPPAPGFAYNQQPAGYGQPQYGQPQYNQPQYQGKPAICD